MYSDDLVDVRVKHAQLLKEIHFLEEEQDALWKKLIKEFNSNIGNYKKNSELSGIMRAREYRDDKPGLFVVFTVNAHPTARALSKIEEDTGLVFKGNLCNDISDNIYIFDLK